MYVIKDCNKGKIFDLVENKWVQVVLEKLFTIVKKYLCLLWVWYLKKFQMFICKSLKTEVVLMLLRGKEYLCILVWWYIL